MDLRAKYNQAIQVAKSLHMNGSAQERDGKLHFVGTVTSEDEKNRIWNALKTVSDWRTDVVADIKVVAPAAPAAAAPAPAAKTYTVQAGDTLSKIAKAQLGNAGEYHPDLRGESRSTERSRQDKTRPGAAHSGLNEENGHGYDILEPFSDRAQACRIATGYERARQPGRSSGLTRAAVTSASRLEGRYGWHRGMDSLRPGRRRRC